MESVQPVRMKLLEYGSKFLMKSFLLDAYRILFERFGSQNWWPAETTFEMIVGAILTQCTSWTNVERAINNLKNAGIMSLKAMFEIDESRLADLVRPSGYFNQKAKKLKEFVGHVYRNWNGDLDKFLNQPLTELRAELLSIYGIGYETADSIILYGANKPVFVVDRYTHRFLSRHGLCDAKYNYHLLQEIFMTYLEPDTELFKEYHALIVRLGKDFCKRDPVCGDCPLSKLSGKGDYYG